MAWRVPSAAVAVLALFGAEVELVALPAIALPAQAELAAPAVRRCPHCGWIESKRQVLPSVYEYTLRMGDGSSSVFQETLPATWRVGERLKVIAGTAPLK